MLQPAPNALLLTRRKLRILVVDDNRDSVITLAAVLRDEGHDVRAAYDGGQALAVAREFGPEAVLLDIAMPGGVSGWEVARQIRKASGDASRPFIIAISAKYKQSPEKMAICNHFLTKPYDPNFLLSLLLPLSSLPAQPR
ncbi:MAG TPA: response regulator [Burkholderiales bacterium]|nr:response regulator [Burkholderiales bacterium]